MDSDIIFDKLNPEQKEAVMCTEGPLLVFAGAGSGKTRVITNRIAYLIVEKGINPKNVLAVTFTKKASGEMLERVRNILGLLEQDISNMPLIGTFHSIGAIFLRQNAKEVGLLNNFSIYDSNDTENLIKEIMLERQIDIKQIKPKAISYFIERAKNDLVSPEKFPLHYVGYIEDMAGEIYMDYQKQLQAQNAVDFGDLLYLTVKMLSENEKILEKYQNKYKYILIDEYQDTNNAQYMFAKLLSQKHQNICVVGDDDQGIYAWRGADIKNIQSFESDFENVKVIKLEQNYRSTKNVIEAAVSVIQQNNLRVGKNLWTDNRKGEPISIYQSRDQEEEAEYVVDNIRNIQDNISLKSIAVLYRTNYQSRAVEEAFLKAGLPYKLVGGFRFYERKEIKDIISYLRFIYNLKDELSLDRILNVPTRKMGPKSVKELHNIAKKCGCTIGELLVNVYSTKSSKNLEKFKDELSKLSNVIDTFGSLYVDCKDMDVLELIDTVLERTRYIEWFDDGSDIAQMKKENITELKNVAYTYVSRFGEKSLEMFLNEINLIEQEQDKNKDGSGDYINLMTLHASKGLEFDYVFLIGMEEGLLPHSRAFVDENELEEERRLCYVGITRAKKKLFLTFAENRQTRNGYSSQIPSRFLGEIPQDICEYFSWNA
ncbi:MAG: UvrD-helicase domain-containing protein [Candidatus Dojkabacteria bacterium]|nr:UvrD-helicase domain-containing protein [Candidatus Dojkabacteria bacterium]